MISFLESLKMNKNTPTHPKTMPLKRLVKIATTDKVVSSHTLTMSLTPVTLLLCDLTSSSFFFSFDFPRTFSRFSLSSSMSDSVSGSSSSSSNCSVSRSGHYKYFPLMSDFSQLIKGALALSKRLFTSEENDYICWKVWKRIVSLLEESLVTSFKTPK